MSRHDAPDTVDPIGAGLAVRILATTVAAL